MLWLYFVNLAICTISSTIASFALSIWIYQSTDSFLAFSYSGIAFLFPLLILTPPAGYLVDRIGIKSAIVGSSFALACSWLLLSLLLFNSENAWYAIPFLAIIGAFMSLQMPAYQSLIAASVEKEKLTQANGVLGGIGALSGVIAPIAAGFLMKDVSIYIFCAIAFIAFLLQALVLSVRAKDDLKVDSDDTPDSTMQALKQTLFFILKSKTLFSLLVFSLFVNTFAETSGVMLTPLGVDIFDEAKVGMLITIAALGALIGNILLASIPINSNKLGWILALNIGQTSVLFTVAFYTNLGFTALCVGIVIFFVLEAIYDGVDLSYWQERAPEKIRASLLSFKTTFSILTMILGYLCMPLLLEFSSAQYTNFSAAPAVGVTEESRGLLAIGLLVVGILNAIVVAIYSTYLLFKKNEVQDEVVES